MENFRTVYILHKKTEYYSALVVKEFWKWIGFSYITYEISDLTKDVLYTIDDLKNVDMIININNAVLQEDLKEFIGIENEDKLMSIQSNNMYNGILGQFESILRKKTSESELMLELLKIYQNVHLEAVLYDYTTVLFPYFGEDERKRISDKFHSALFQLENIQINYGSLPDKSDATSYIEYYLYAKFFCQRKINELCKMEARKLEYDLENYLENIDSIYLYDKKFFKVEYLKAKVASLSLQKSPFARFYYERCLDRNEISICSSFFYYDLGKWLQGNQLSIEADKAYKLAYMRNTDNIKAVYKLALIAKEQGDLSIMQMFLEKITEQWKDEKNRKNIALMDLEYIYKSFKQLEFKAIVGIAEVYKGLADSVKSYIVDTDWEMETDAIMYLVFKPIGLPFKEIVNAMAYRIGTRESIECK